jgi:NAD(P)H dehydrogenase (quinone)
VVLETILHQNLMAPSSIRISSSSNRVTSTKAKTVGIEVRYGDMTKPETLIQSFAGADAVFLVSYPSVGEERFKLHQNAIDAAKKAGVKHIIYTSLTFGGVEGEHSTAGVMNAHLKTVQYLKSSGLSWTVVREATYAHLWNNFAGFLRLDDTGECDVVVSHDGLNSWASRQDLGEATAKIVACWVCDSVSVL